MHSPKKKTTLQYTPNLACAVSPYDMSYQEIRGGTGRKVKQHF
ncbi:unnamed protein product [Staurois parvus]|uniref:Uncharacterized protein n=1 Tax=Staurois parvus TaxID=386267 RepID=A0ABN9G8R8_9NEOB|nr:unnamed protein product [Staurois parvus]